MSFKKTKVVMLPTEKSSDIILRTRDNVIHQKKYYGTAWEDMGDVYQHLYFLSDDEIKEGDWCVNLAHKLVVKPTDIEWANSNKDNLKKIIATTDRLEIPYQWSIIPQPSEGFIQKFVESYNSGNQISEVDVEYNHLLTTFGIDEESLKINPKDNTITIKKAKDTWSRDEVINLLQQFNNDKSGAFDCTKWIEENL